MEYVLAVDGGNSKTLALLADRTGTVLGTGRAGGSNHQSAGGFQRAMAEIRRAAEAAMETLLPSELASAAMFCLAGADMPEDFAALRPALRDLGLAKQLDLTNDSIAILRAGTDSRNAVAVGWGAGTTAAGWNEEGQTAALPALGWISGDWGGGGELAREVVSAVARAGDGRGRPTMLTDLVLAELEVPSIDAMIHLLYLVFEAPYYLPEGDARRTRINIHRFTPLLFTAAEAGDDVALALLQRAAQEVTVTALAMLRRLDLTDRPADVVLGGSVFQAGGELLVRLVRQRLAAAAPNATVVVPAVEPVAGALFLAFDMLGWPVDASVRTTAGRFSRQSLPEVEVP